MLVKTKFSIKDLENLSGIKAHTIRIWEKRYQVLQPDRTDTNIRTYDIDNLKHLLNIAMLYSNGYKISKIAKLDKPALSERVAELSSTRKEEHAIKQFKTAMFQFDQGLFAKTYSDLRATKSFPKIFSEVFIPLLKELGYLWQTGTIDPCHERFVSEMVKQKIIVNIEHLYEENGLSGPPRFALFLPYGEIHDIGIIYANYLCIRHGINTIYLGSNIAVSSLREIISHHNDIQFMTYLTVEPSDESVEDFCNNYNSLFERSDKRELWLMGSKIKSCDPSLLSPNIKLLQSIPELEQALENLKK